jgi:ketosteroid isomerase-like protein
MTVRDIAEAFAELCRTEKWAEAGETFWADDIVSIEAMEGDMARLEGRAAVRAKAEWWDANHEVHGSETRGPYVNGTQFALVISLDVTAKATGERSRMEEVALYTVRDGRIVEERFFY